MSSARKRRWAVVTAAVASVAVGAGLLVNAVASSGIDRHLDGNGPLGTGPGGGLNSVSFSFYQGDPGPWTVGYQLCLVQGTDPAVIENVSPATSVGSGFRVLGVLARVLGAGDGGIGNVAGYPPKVPQRLQPAAGFRVTNACAEGSPRPPAAELLVGLAKLPGSHGGGWTGTNVAYRVGSRQYVVTLNQSFYACGVGVLSASPGCSTLLGSPPPARPPTSFQGS